MSLRVVEPVLPDLPGASIAAIRSAQRWLRLIFMAIGIVLILGLGGAFLVEVSQYVTAPGSTEPLRVWDVRAEQMGVVVALKTRTGDIVAAGQEVAQIDDRSFRNETRMLEHRLSNGVRELKKARRTLPVLLAQQAELIEDATAQVIRARATFRSRLIDQGFTGAIDSLAVSYKAGSSVALDLAWADLRSAEAALGSARAANERVQLDSLDLERQSLELEAIRSELEFRRGQRDRFIVRAPWMGRVITDELENLIGKNVAMGERLMEVATVGTWRTVLRVAERDVHDVHPGQEVRIEIPALAQLDGRQPRGMVTAVAPQPIDGPGAGFRVVVTLDSADIDSLGLKDLRRGYAVRGRIVTRRGPIAKLIVAAVRDRINRFR